MTGLLPKKFQDRLRTIPSHLQYSSSSRSLKYGELLSALNLMDKEKCIVFDKGEYEREYGKHAVAGLKATAKKNKFPFYLRIVQDGTNIVIFKNDPLKK